MRFGLGITGNKPVKRHVRGVGAKEQREYEHIVDSAKKSGCYKGREQEGGGPGSRLLEPRRRRKNRHFGTGRQAPAESEEGDHRPAQPANFVGLRP